MFDYQAIYDKVKTHLLSQNEQSGSYDECAYRGQDGLKCAIGCLISDEAYSSDLEGLGVCTKKVLRALRLSGIDIEYTEDFTPESRFLGKLQNVHDGLRPNEWPEVLATLAEEYRLKP